MSASMFDFCSFTHQFKLNFLETENFALGQSVSSEVISAGGHLWRIDCYPNGHDGDYDYDDEDDGYDDDDGDGADGKYLSIYLQHESESEGIKAIFEAFVIDKDGTPSSHRKRFVHVFGPKGSFNNNRGWLRFVKRSEIETLYLTNGCFIIMCGAKVEQEDELLKSPPSDIGSHLGLLLDCTDGSDVTFIVDGEKFPAHRAVLAARSPVFKARLLGSMAEMPSITLHAISPATFKVMLRFIYTDAFPKNDELGDSRDDMVRHLLAAADCFALDRLKILCAADLWDNISVDTVAATLICAETYNCPQLKKNCIDFIVEEKNFKKVVLTVGFFQLAHQFPSIIDELKLKVGA